MIIRSGCRRPEQARQSGEDPSLLPTTTTNSTIEPTTMYHNNHIPIHVILEPSWRDHGHLQFRQYFPRDNSTTTTLVHQHPKIQMVVHPPSATASNSDHTCSSSNNNSISQKPQVMIDLIVPYPEHRHDETNASTASSNSTSDYYHNNIAALPKTTPELALEDSSNKWMEEAVVEDSDDGDDATHENRPVTGDDTTYVVLTLQIPEQLNVTCSLLHHHDSDPKDTSTKGHVPRTDHDPTDYCYDPTTTAATNNKSSITIRNKIEGDILHLHNTNGNISVTKLRAHDMTLQSTNGVIYASNLLEAQRLTLNCSSDDDNDYDQSRIRAKQIHASQVDITVDQRQAQSATTCITTNTTNTIGLMDPEDDEGSLVDISSLFVSGPNGGASITVHGPNHSMKTEEETATLSQQHQRLRRRAVRIKSHHGPIQVLTNRLSKPIEKNPTTQQYYPIVELGGVNGSCEVSIDSNNTDDPTTSRTNLSTINDDEVFDDEWSSCLVHIDSFAPDSVSLVTANTGHIDITLDRKVEADIRLASLFSESGSECVNEVGALLAEEDDNHHIVNILSHLPSTTEVVNHDPSSDERILIHTSAFTNRPENALYSRNVTYMDGWVENKSSEPDSRFERKNRGHEGVGKIRLDGAHTQALHSFTGGEGSQDHVEHTDHHRPLLAVVGTSDICVETVSWIGAIARRYGLDESGRELGRTASRKGRAIESELQQ